MEDTSMEDTSSSRQRAMESGESEGADQLSRENVEPDPLDAEAERRRARPHRPPALGPGRTRSDHLRVRITSDEFETIYRRARARDASLPDWVRRRLIYDDDE